MRLRTELVGVLLVASLATVAGAQEGVPTPESRIEAIKQSLVTSKAMLKQYEWVETVVLSLSGEEKVRQQYRCYHGAEGGLQKVPVAADAKEDKKRGIRGKVVESKKAELQASLKSAVELLRQYSPPDPERIQAAKNAGNVSVSLPSGEGRVRVTIKNYLKPGDAVELELDAAKNLMHAIAVTSSIEQAKSKSPVSARVSFAALQDGTLYPAQETLEISAQNLKVDVQNSGYRKQSP